MTGAQRHRGTRWTCWLLCPMPLTGRPSGWSWSTRPREPLLGETRGTGLSCPRRRTSGEGLSAARGGVDHGVGRGRLRHLRVREAMECTSRAEWRMVLNSESAPAALPTVQLGEGTVEVRRWGRGPLHRSEPRGGVTQRVSVFLSSGWPASFRLCRALAAACLSVPTGGGGGPSERLVTN